MQVDMKSRKSIMLCRVSTQLHLTGYPIQPSECISENAPNAPIYRADVNAIKRTNMKEKVSRGENKHFPVQGGDPSGRNFAKGRPHHFLDETIARHAGAVRGGPGKLEDAVSFAGHC